MSENTKYIKVSFCGNLLTEKQFANREKALSTVPIVWVVGRVFV